MCGTCRVYLEPVALSRRLRVVYRADLHRDVGGHRHRPLLTGCLCVGGEVEGVRRSGDRCRVAVLRDCDDSHDGTSTQHVDLSAPGFECRVLADGHLERTFYCGSTGGHERRLVELEPFRRAVGGVVDSSQRQVHVGRDREVALSTNRFY